MKKIVSTLLLILITFIAFGQITHNGLPVIKAKALKTDYKIGNDLIKGSWTISPQIDNDSLFIICRSGVEDVVFYTDIDSIKIKLSPDKILDFYISINDTTFAHTIIKGLLPKITTLQFDENQKNNDIVYRYENNRNNEYLNLLRSRFPIDSLIRNAKTDTEKATKILSWVHNQWKHDGNNQPKKRDAISILEEVKEGKRFRCVEYGIVAASCLNSVGLNARVLSLKIKNVETAKYGAGHVLLEVYLNDLKKWVLLDGQWDAMPVLNGTPLNAVEFQNAINNNYNELEIRSSSGLSKRKFIDWIYPYLYYFSVAFDNREGIDLDLHLVNGKKVLMLVPIGAKNPTIFQITGKTDNCIYTNSLLDFYSAPANF